MWWIIVRLKIFFYFNPRYDFGYSVCVFNDIIVDYMQWLHFVSLKHYTILSVVLTITYMVSSISIPKPPSTSSHIYREIAHNQNCIHPV